MKLRLQSLITFGLAFALICVSGYIGATGANVYRNRNKVAPTPSPKGQILNVTITCADPTFCKTKTVEIPARVLATAFDKPDDIHPRHLSIQFIGEYKEQNRNSKFEPEINIYSIPEFRESLSKSTEYVKEFDRELEKIKHLASDQFSVANGELPFLPFIDAEKELNVHLKRVSFKSGNGFFYLTQFNNEPSIINNDGLVYVFQGVTNDNQYYILATFPVRTKILPEGYDASEFQGYKLPEFFYERKKHKRNQVNYRNYVSKMGKLLEELESDQFSPSLSLIEEVQSSLEINY